VPRRSPIPFPFEPTITMYSHALDEGSFLTIRRAAFSHDPHNDKGPSLESSFYPIWPFPIYIYIYPIICLICKSRPMSWGARLALGI
jgi:hypothetical protein